MYDGGHDLLGAPGDEDSAQLGFLAGAALRWFRRHLKDEPVPEEDGLSPVTLYRTATGGFESYDALPDGERTLSLRAGAGPGATPLRTGPGGTATAAFDFEIDTPLALGGAGELALRVTPRGGEPILSAALAKVSDGDVTVLKDQVAVTPVTGRGTTTVTCDLIGAEATFEPGDTLRLLVGVSDDSLAPGLTDGLLYDLLGSPAQLQKSSIGEYVPETVPSTDGLYFDSPRDPPTGVVIHHTRPSASQVTLRTLPAASTEGSAEQPEGRPASQLQTPDF